MSVLAKTFHREKRDKTEHIRQSLSLQGTHNLTYTTE